MIVFLRASVIILGTIIVSCSPAIAGTLNVPDRDVNTLYQAFCHETHGEQSEKCKGSNQLVGQEIMVADEERKGEMVANYFFFRGYFRSQLRKECDI
jgi:hypothetical protein